MDVQSGWTFAPFVVREGSQRTVTRLHSRTFCDMAADAFSTPTRRRLSDLPNSPAVHQAWDLSGPNGPYADVAVESIVPAGTAASSRKPHRSSDVLRQEMLGGGFLMWADPPTKTADPFHGVEESEIAPGSFVYLSAEVRS